MHPRVFAYAAILANKGLHFPIKDIEEFVAGLVEGLIQKNDMVYIQSCMKDGATIDAEMTDAIGDFAQKDVLHIVDGIEKIGEVLSSLEQDYSDCSGMRQDILRIEMWSAIFHNPKALMGQVVGNLLLNYQSVIGDITNITSDIGQHDMHAVGKDISDILVTAVGPVPETEDVESIVPTQW